MEEDLFDVDYVIDGKSAQPYEAEGLFEDGSLGEMGPYIPSNFFSAPRKMLFPILSGLPQTHQEITDSTAHAQ